MTILEESAGRQAQDAQAAAIATLQKHKFYGPLAHLQGTVDATGSECVSMAAIFDFLGIPPKRRERRLHSVIVDILGCFGWSAVFVQKDGKQTALVRSFERKPTGSAASAKPAAIPVEPEAPLAADLDVEPDAELDAELAPVEHTPPVATTPAPKTVAYDGPTIRLRGVDIPMSADNEIFVQFVMDVARVVEQIKNADSVCESYRIEDWQRDVVGNALLDRFVRNACEMRIRNGDAPQEFARHTMPEAMKAMRGVITDERAANRDKTAAAKLVTDVAGSTQGSVGVKSNFSIDIDLGNGNGIHLKDVILYPRS
jgi:hypothetical protein